MSPENAGPILMFEIYRWGGTSPEEFRQHYVDVHARLGMRLPGIVWYESFLPTNPQREWPIQDGRARPDGFVIIQFESEAALEALFGTEEWARAKLDDIGFVSNSVSYRVERYTWIPERVPGRPYYGEEPNP